MPQSANWARATRRLDARGQRPRARLGLERRGRPLHDAAQARGARAHAGTRSQNVAPTPGAVEDPRRPAVRLGDAAHEREPEAGAAGHGRPRGRRARTPPPRGRRARRRPRRRPRSASRPARSRRVSVHRRRAAPVDRGVVEHVQQRALDPRRVEPRDGVARAASRPSGGRRAASAPAVADAVEERAGARPGSGARRRGGRRSRRPPSRSSTWSTRRGGGRAARAAAAVSSASASWPSSASSRRIARTGSWSSSDASFMQVAVAAEGAVELLEHPVEARRELREAALAAGHRQTRGRVAVAGDALGGARPCPPSARARRAPRPTRGRRGTRARAAPRRARGPPG